MKEERGQEIGSHHGVRKTYDSGKGVDFFVYYFLTSR